MPPRHASTTTNTDSLPVCHCYHCAMKFVIGVVVGVSLVLSIGVYDWLEEKWKWR